MRNDLISICVTTRHRPELLMVCLQSLLRQAHRPLELVIGDNSENDESERLVGALALPPGVSVVYHRHQPTTDWAENNAWVFRQARGGRVMLMHDDDLLCDGGLDLLVQGWVENPDAAVVYGRVRHIRFDGEYDPVETERRNTSQMQQAQFAGRQPSNELAALNQQIPPNGWLADGDLVRRIGCWRSPALVGTFCDVDFGIRLAKAAGSRPFVYIHAFVGSMRQGPTRLSTDRTVDIGAIRFLAQLEPLEFPAECRESRDRLMRSLTEVSVVEAARLGERRRALALLRSPYYRRSWASAHTLYRLLYIASPGLTRAVNRVFRRV